MKTSLKTKIIAVAAAGIFAVSGATFAQGDQAASLEDLLQMVKNS